MEREVCMDMDLQKIDYFKVFALLKTFKGRSAQLNIIGAITVPFWINKFDYANYTEEIMVGEFEDEIKQFYIQKDNMDVWTVYDDFSSEDRLIFKLKNDEFITWIEIVCSLEGIEMDGKYNECHECENENSLF